MASIARGDGLMTWKFSRCRPDRFAQIIYREILDNLVTSLISSGSFLNKVEPTFFDVSNIYSKNLPIILNNCLNDTLNE